MQLLIAGDPSHDELAKAAAEAGWPISATAAALVCAAADLSSILPRAPAGCAGAVADELGVIAVSDPDGPGRREALARAVGDRGAALGPSVGPAEFRLSRTDAATALATLAPSGLLETEEHLLALVLAENADRLQRIVDRRLRAAIAELTPNAAERTLQTLRSYLDRMGNVGAMAEDLHLHPQTVRYRVGRLRELLDPQLDDPEARLELAAALAGLRDSAQPLE